MHKAKRGEREREHSEYRTGTYIRVLIIGQDHLIGALGKQLPKNAPQPTLASHLRIPQWHNLAVPHCSPMALDVTTCDTSGEQAMIIYELHHYRSYSL